MKLSEFLRQKLNKRGEQAKLARKLGISTATASKWASGEIDVQPRFEGCLKIATHYGISPIEVFEMAERPDFKDLFLELVPGFERKPAPIQDDNAFVCHNPEHRMLHQLLDEILDGKREDADDWRNGIIANLRAMRLAAIIGDTPPERDDPSEHWESKSSLTKKKRDQVV